MSDHEVLPQRDRREKRRRGIPKSVGPPVSTQGKRKVDDISTKSGISESGEVIDHELDTGVSWQDSTHMGIGVDTVEDEEGTRIDVAYEQGDYFPARENYEYLDHTADIQLHSWGATLEEAFEGSALAMFNYMTPLAKVRVDEKLTRTYEMQAHDMESLLFGFLDELLYVFSTDLFVCCDLKITSFDRESWTITAIGRGETFSLSQHEQGTEVKAITYSAMQITEGEGRCDVCVIVDI
mmetsp:Transcript_8144/g.15417  ORF Transcript_8144/g.15417 Transcript_8144/m.15417 type:complete len:238 (-) Transcript_8144:158-871(-)